jgi:hypothetical protein
MELKAGSNVDLNSSLSWQLQPFRGDGDNHGRSFLRVKLSISMSSFSPWSGAVSTLLWGVTDNTPSAVSEGCLKKNVDLRAKIEGVLPEIDRPGDRNSHILLICWLSSVSVHGIKMVMSCRGPVTREPQQR